MRTGADHEQTKTPPDALDEDMTIADLTDVLATLRLRSNGTCLIIAWR